MNQQNNGSLRCAALLAILALTLTVIPALAQHPAPPTARQAAADPAFASRLAHPGTAQAPTKQSPASVLSRKAPASPQDSIIYKNGPVNGICDIQGCTVDAWTVNYGMAVTDSFPGGSVTGLNLAVWLFPGDHFQAVDVLFGTQPYGNDAGQLLGLSPSGVTDLGINQYGYDIQQIAFQFPSVNLGTGTYWLTLQNAVENQFGDPVYWDENNGPSTAYENTLGSIASESFNVSGNNPDNDCFQPDRHLRILHSFSDQEGSPNGLTSGFYGTTGGGGDNGYGMAYKVTSRSSFTPLYSFTGDYNGWGGAPVIRGSDGALYGATGGGIKNCGSGNDYCGLIFRLGPPPKACDNPPCSWTEAVLYRPTGNNDAWGPGGLIFDQAGNLYGIAAGGAYGYGAVFELTPSRGGWTQQIIYSFAGGSDGSGPSSLLVGNDGNLYGTTSYGGDLPCGYQGQGCGTVFQLARLGASWGKTILYTVHDQDGAKYIGGLLQNSSGTFYVTASYAGSEGIFMLAPSDGNWVFSLLWQPQERESLLDLGMSDLGDLIGVVIGGDGYITYYYGFALEPGWYMELFRGDGFLYASGPLVIEGGGTYISGTTWNCGAYNHGTVWEWSY